MYIEDKDIHKGHRARMKAKLEAYGMRIFDTYELLEMLLYYVIPYKDTNPIAKRLLAEFGSLDAVLQAPVEELAAVDGIGERCAQFITSVGKVIAEENSHIFRREVKVYNDYNRVGKYLVEHFEKSGANACMMMLDSGMRLIDTVDIQVSDFGSAAVKPRLFVSPAILMGASVVMLAHRRHSLLHFSDATLATDKLIRTELSRVGVTVAEHYVISGKDYAGFRSNYVLCVEDDSPELEKFLESVASAVGGTYEQ